MPELSTEERVQIKVEELDKVMEEYLESKNLGKSSFNPNLLSNVKDYLQYSRIEVKSLTAEECGEIAYVLLQYSLYIQLEFNKEQGRADWCDAQIAKVIALECKEFGTNYTPYEERKNMAIKSNDISRRLNDIKIQAKLRANALSFIAGTIKNMADIINSQKITKQKWSRNE